MKNPRPISSRPWRVLFEGAQSGARNMAIDEALARVHLDDRLGASPTLRFYEWEPRCLSLGRLQKLDGPLQVLQVLEEHRAGLDWVRRPSGGRAVWHQSEVTYSLSLSLDDLPAAARSVVGAYEWLSRPLLRGLASLGVRAELATFRGGEKGERNCFLSSSQADAVVDGRKLIGGAQCRFETNSRTAILQHGSILIDFDPVQWLRAMGEEPSHSGLELLRSRVLSLRELGVGGLIPEVRQLVQQAIVLALSDEFEVEESALSPREDELRDELEANKYLSVAWNERGQLPG